MVLQTMSRHKKLRSQGGSLERRKIVHFQAKMTILSSYFSGFCGFYSIMQGGYVGPIPLNATMVDKWLCKL